MSFRKKISSRKFIVTAEISPPKGTDVRGMLKDAELIKDVVDAINITDNQRAVMRMSPMAACGILSHKGYETIMHLTCRDRNRIALQSELLGAWALEVHNILVMSGDHPVKGDHEAAKPVYDLDSVQLLGMIDGLNQGFDFSGHSLHGETDFCAGAVTNAELNEAAFAKLEKKIKAGARFIQTQAVFDTEKFTEFMDKIRGSDTFEEIKIIAGVIPLRSEKNADFLNRNIAGIRVPEDMISRMHKAKSPVFEGMEIASELIKELRLLCDGVHIMTIGTHEKTPGILEMAGIR
ncbi:MAG: methylenetetrahydrofolate reductase [Candidatus Methanoperedens sp.]|nr:methylenetetrahydrofolate reductase [Candidatus Methanoperedens sp.]MCZ7360267.1 methylenetetrahydrofolate reductase [Candidatus Methanoperedens sp.]HLB70269.1 methylenetetrahydrofolate reductase [Candidatus Methanoperedens sp.]